VKKRCKGWCKRIITFFYVNNRRGIDAGGKCKQMRWTLAVDNSLLWTCNLQCVPVMKPILKDNMQHTYIHTYNLTLHATHTRCITRSMILLGFLSNHFFRFTMELVVTIRAEMVQCWQNWLGKTMQGTVIKHNRTIAVTITKLSTRLDFTRPLLLDFDVNSYSIWIQFVFKLWLTRPVTIVLYFFRIVMHFSWSA